MICISIAQVSRALALVDMHNAARQCDLLEIRLDRFAKAPRVHELLHARPKPVIMTCRREQDGGEWRGNEDERRALLRQCIADGADYVEIELDAADAIPPHSGTKRVISFTNLKETPPNIGEIYKRALQKHPDVIKLTTVAATPEAAWPLLRIVAQAKVPTVIVGLGKPGNMLAILGRKVGSPWTYAALEKGMEAYPEEPTISDLQKIYHFRQITPKTRFVGVTGQTTREDVTIGVFNGMFAQLELPFRCLPLAVGNVRLFRKVMDLLKLSAVIVGEQDQAKLFTLAEETDSQAKGTHAVELLVRKKGVLHGFNHSYKGAVEGLAATLRARGGQEQPLKGRMAALVGVNWLARAIGVRLLELGVGVIILSRDKARAQKLARALGCRFAAMEALYSTSHDILIHCHDEAKAVDGKKVEDINPGYLKPSMVVMDLTCGLGKSTLLEEAERRGCTTVPPRQLFMSHLQRQVRLLTGKTIPAEPMAVIFNSLLPEEQ